MLVMIQEILCLKAQHPLGKGEREDIQAVRYYSKCISLKYTVTLFRSTCMAYVVHMGSEQ